MPRNPGNPIHRFKKGFDPSRNIYGRPKLGVPLAEKIRAALEAETKDGMTVNDEILKMAISHIKRGSHQLLQMLWDRGYGKVPDKVEVNQEEKTDFSRLTDEELAQYTALLEKVIIK